MSKVSSAAGRLAIIGNYLPRRCGIATFTTHLCEAIVAHEGEGACFAIPVNDRPGGYAYPGRVRFELTERDLTSYQRAADFLNISNVDVVCLQHEYGIFGGPAGSHILALLRDLRMPIVTTLHTVLEEPDPGQRQVLEELAVLSDRFVVMSARATEFLTRVYGVPAAKIALIPHGIPDVPFVDPNFYIECIGAADLYLTPYLSRTQIVSGTLAYSMGAGKAVVSTPYWYAAELLDEGRGLLVPFGDSEAIAARVVDLLSRDADRHAMRKRAYLLGRDMIWPVVARRYLDLFAEVREARARHLRPVFEATTLEQRTELPDLKLDHLRTMTDDTGLLQHATYTVPNYDEGYTTDDNARALVLTVLLEQSGDATPLGTRYLAFLWHAFDWNTTRFRNVMAYDRRWLDPIGSSEDAHGRAVWALGLVLGRSEQEGFRGLASRLFEHALPAVRKLTSPRAWATAILGIHAYLRRYRGDRNARLIELELADRLLELYARTSQPAWQWFEDVLSYDNAALPQALLAAGLDLERAELTDAGLSALSWLIHVQLGGGSHFVPIGSNGFYPRGGARARFDQQPVEAAVTVSACLEADQVTGDHRWYEEATRAFEWFLGRNDLGLSLYDPLTGGCRDGLHPDRVSQNEGAESTLALLTALVEMRLAEHVIDARRGVQTLDSTGRCRAPARVEAPTRETPFPSRATRSWATDSSVRSSIDQTAIPS
ncbi:MAG: hypothetical protein DMF96_10795 [Acidobacteria bacterium]|nr:MAG: hypothetical protein DMF96_10795 [Acidobacteriota bacterium]